MANYPLLLHQGHQGVVQEDWQGGDRHARVHSVIVLLEEKEVTEHLLTSILENSPPAAVTETPQGGPGSRRLQQA